ncbi:MerR family transcriptional regulator [Enterococcus sp. HY326]|uniref:MerR family transcriptional regulator n=1 Tax=Enterococcus sp. HY326 TaxID=2971265 RepID=UPI00223F2497|nr:MerR family transcriptional regulator [Enterococcus sp. HY326]
MMYTVAETAKIINTSPHTLRYYSNKGLLPFVERSESGIRLFKEEDFKWLFLIDCLKNTGMPLREIKQFVDWAMTGDETIDDRLAMFEEREIAVKEQIAQMEEYLAFIQYKKWRYQVSKEAGTTAIHETMSESEIPADILAIKKRSEELHPFLE